MKKNAGDSGDHYSWTGGVLKPSCYQDYAAYFVKWIQYMDGQGFDIYAVTPQNEPLNAGNSMSMLMYWDQERDFIKTALGPALAKAGLTTKILVFDHNYDYDGKSSQTDYPLNIYADSDASKYVAGSAWHNYGGSVSELDHIVKEAPDKEIYFTEASIGTWNYSFNGCLLDDMRDIFLGTLARECKGVTLWNLMLDDNKGPYTNASGSCTTCYGAVTVASSDYVSVDYLSQYYDIAHCSKVIRPGAVRIGTKGYSADGITYQVYKNTDGSYGVVVLNENSTSQQLVFISESHSVSYLVPAKAIVSLRWKD
jgi:glucosylceramidase